MMVTIDTRYEGEKFPSVALDEVDEVMEKMGYVKAVRSVIEWGKYYSSSYEGPDIDSSRLEESINAIAGKYNVKATITKEESHTFP